ncbi:Predicted GTPase [Candidatus Kryptonium thompsonii]|uniref:Predicted GTPase n=1 Tax=Candidatus Kryptonium thompsonii TaxID=1633631 RepID=A0A0P1LFV0_9BACT|nr:cyclic 2,3-diphosphoglycerate synthase [Candidatus Kryptonium thompsoni]CUS79017.1 Predicted GTPase [Candidatus Kryptonium thompsoni]CUS80129.1 Predicted GTPase [Candidatus Kryptonium thompsoni]CUS84954.1 Predicted GTPase [Candidatus Kryptonium thompsoni]CUS87422.1 Predicted GTPase [Candidatus Kryptonium thompsoni]CUS87999.1 Predicted GTPase [Candidatus Kryptonium thompsoni]
MDRKKVIIMGAAGRDFHNFNMYYRDNENYEVVAFTATQIPNIENRKYPPELAGKLYPKGIPIYPEEKLEELIKKFKVDEVVFSYSDVSHQYVMERASRVISAGASFRLLGLNQTMLKSKVPVVAVVAVRTGCGKSQTSRKVARLLREMGLKVVVVRHPMPYGDLRKQVVQRFASIEDMYRQNCTIEEMEEYEPHIANGGVVYAGVDYEKILREAEKEADVIIWDGGNNDMPFFKPDLTIVVTDPHRPGHELTYYPGSSNLRIADVVVINKVDSANPADVETVRNNIKSVNPKAIIIEAASPIFVEDGSLIRGKRALAVEDGPTLTHGEMSYGAAVLAAKKFGAKELVDPRDYAVGSIKETFEKYTQIRNLLPAVGYGKEQIKELEKTINRTPADIVIIGTPIDLRRVLKLNKPSVRVKYELQEIGKPDLVDILTDFVKSKKLKV